MTWHGVSLKQICDVDWGNTKLTKSSYVENGKFLAISAAGADGLIDHYEHEANVPVLSAIGAQCGRMFFPGAKFTAIKNTITLTPKENMADGKFLYYLFTHIQLPQRGAGQPFISKGDIEAFQVLVPETLDEQRLIVDKLDRAFADIDLIEENFASLESLINECDASILGRVLNSNNREVEGHLNSTLGDATELITRGISPTYLDSANTVVLNQRCIRNGRIDLDFSRHHDEKTKRVQEAKLLQRGDGLINSTGVGTLGRTALFDHPGIGDFTIDSHVTIIRPKKDTLDSDYFGLVLRALENVFVSLSTGTSGQTELPREAIKDIGITFPKNLDDQKDFFAYYNSLNFAVIEFRKVLINKRVLAETLRSSLLSSAFTKVEEVA
jgi:type I restriction enzyme S subunit